VPACSSIDQMLLLISRYLSRSGRPTCGNIRITDRLRSRLKNVNHPGILDKNCRSYFRNQEPSCQTSNSVVARAVLFCGSSSIHALAIDCTRQCGISMRKPNYFPLYEQDFWKSIIQQRCEHHSLQGCYCGPQTIHGMQVRQADRHPANSS
jgi:hypothetical protein